MKLRDVVFLDLEVEFYYDARGFKIIDEDNNG